MEVKGISSKTGSKLAFDPAKFMNIPNASQFTLISKKDGVEIIKGFQFKIT